jgi:hypothetical protein
MMWSHIQKPALMEGLEVEVTVVERPDVDKSWTE